MMLTWKIIIIIKKHLWFCFNNLGSLNLNTSYWPATQYITCFSVLMVFCGMQYCINMYACIQYNNFKGAFCLESPMYCQCCDHFFCWLIHFENNCLFAAFAHSLQDFIDITLSKTQRKTPTVVHKHYQIHRIRHFYMRKVKFTQQNYHDRLTQILTDFPKLDVSHREKSPVEWIWTFVWFSKCFICFCRTSTRSMPTWWTSCTTKTITSWPWDKLTSPRIWLTSMLKQIFETRTNPKTNKRVTIQPQKSLVALSRLNRLDFFSPQFAYYGGRWRRPMPFVPPSSSSSVLPKTTCVWWSTAILCIAANSWREPLWVGCAPSWSVRSPAWSIWSKVVPASPPSISHSLTRRHAFTVPCQSSSTSASASVSSALHRPQHQDPAPVRLPQRGKVQFHQQGTVTCLRAATVAAC